MSPRCLTTTLTFLAVAVPITALCWGSFWLWRWRWSGFAWEPGDRRLFRWALIWVPIVLVELTVFIWVAAASGTARCLTRYDEAFHRWRTECSDGSRAITRYDAPLNRYRTDVITQPKGDKPPRGWPVPGQALR